ncbi:MAG: flavodoxin family protein [Ignavibacteria bacterium]|nr:flavodoxin family protein [Ignavibacteria bacterium]
MKKILVFNCNPKKDSFSSELAKKYCHGAELSGADCKIINLIDLEFILNLKWGNTKHIEFEDDLVRAQKEIIEAQHLVFVYPNWWGTYPALLKSFVDRVILSGFAFKYRENSLLWDKLLTGRTARLIITMDTPKLYYYLVFKAPGINSMKKSILQFCGINPVKTTLLGPIKTSSMNKRKAWLNQIFELGKKMK